MPQLTASNVLIASVIAAFVGITGFIMSPIIVEHGTKIYISPSQGLITSGETFTIEVKVDADTPVNVFSGLITFDNQSVVIDKIDYNISIADLWAILPWYSNGAGTMNFAGGTTRPGGFMGSDTLITITFRTIEPGEVALHLTETRILKHDGLGTDVHLREDTIDAIFTVTPEALEEITVAKAEPRSSNIRVVNEIPSTDLNGDGKQNFTDMSIIMNR